MTKEWKEHRQAWWAPRMKSGAVIAGSLIGAIAVLLGPQDLVETILHVFLAVSFAAFCIWLAVRIVNRRQRWAKWTAAGLIAAAVIYPLSLGPAHWYVNSRQLQVRRLYAVAGFYRPLHQIAGRVPLIGRSIRWYGDLWSPETPFTHYRSIKRTGKPSKNDAVLFW